MLLSDKGVSDTVPDISINGTPPRVTFAVIRAPGRNAAAASNAASETSAPSTRNGSRRVSSEIRAPPGPRSSNGRYRRASTGSASPTRQSSCAHVENDGGFVVRAAAERVRVPARSKGSGREVKKVVGVWRARVVVQRFLTLKSLVPCDEHACGVVRDAEEGLGSQLLARSDRCGRSRRR